MVPFYEKGGFKRFNRHQRFQLTTSVIELFPIEEVVDHSSVNFSSLVDYDSQVSPFVAKAIYVIDQLGAI